jgi:membrane protein
MLKTLWPLTRQSAEALIDGGALSRGAAIAFYAVTSIGPVLLIVVAVAGLCFAKTPAQKPASTVSAHAPSA